MQITNIPTHLIEASHRLRSLNVAHVRKLKASISLLGLVTPISVYEHDDGGFVLAAGAHRLEAAKELGHTIIAAIVMNGSDLERRLIEVDENLCRLELSPAERALHESERKVIWDARYALQRRQDQSNTASAAGDDKQKLGGTSFSTQLPNTKSNDGRAPELDARGQKKSPQQQPGFAAATAAVTGESKQTINNNVRRGEALGKRLLHEVVDTSLDKGIELDALAKLPPEARVDLVNRAKSGERVSAQKVLRTQHETPEAQNRVLARQAVEALQKCACAMSESEFASALRGTAVPEPVVSFALILTTAR